MGARPRARKKRPRCWRSWPTRSKAPSGSDASSGRPSEWPCPSTAASCPASVGVGRVLEEALELIEDAIRARARLVRDLGPELWVLGEREGLKQLFFNLLSNAVAALPDRAPQRQRGQGRAPADAVRGGADRDLRQRSRDLTEIQERIFQPFFTTRPVGQGAGLGLATCRAIVAALGGDIGFTSVERTGTTFRVLLPTTAAGSSISLLPSSRASAGP